jgi:hypothetical protein
MSESIYDKLTTIRLGYLGILSIIVIIIPVLYPLGLPLVISAPTRGFYNTINELPEGSIIVIDAGGGFASFDEFESSMTAMFKVLCSRDLKWFAWGMTMDGAVLVDVILENVKPEERFGKVYGEDFLILPYISGEEMAVASVAANTQQIATKDYYGNDLSQYPLWSELGGANDYALLITISGGCLNMDQETRQWYSQYGLNILSINMACCSPMDMNYFPNVMPGGLWGVKGGTELEVLSGFPGPGARISDAQNFGLFPFILFLILGNIGYFGKMYIEKEGEES